MIPKVIHYCWFGRGPKPALAERCIASWRRHLPDYEIREWNESNYDVRKIPYIAEAYDAKKYAFVSDYARFDILYRHGGLYFDTDVEVVRPLDDLISAGPFMGFEEDAKGTVASGLGLAAEAGMPIYREILAHYATLHYAAEDGRANQTTVVRHVTELLKGKGLVSGGGIATCAGLRIYPADYFNPMRPDGRIVLLPNTRTIHHYAASWHSPRQRLATWVERRFGRRAAKVASLLTHNPAYIVRRLVTYARRGE